MTYRSRLFVRLVVAPIVGMVAYFIIIFLAVETGYTLHGESYLDHEGEIVLIEAVSGIIIFAIWLAIKKKMIWPSPTWAVGKTCDWSIAVAGAGTMLAVATAYMFLVSRLDIAAVERALDEYTEAVTVRSVTRADLYMSVIATCFLIPVLEEIIFRGCIMEGMLELGHPYVAIVLSAMYFGVMHGQIIQIGYAFIAGIVLGIIYYSTKNLVMPIIAHSIFNIVGSGLYTVFEVSETADTVLTIIQFICIPVFVLLAVFLLKKRDERFPKPEETGDINKMLPGRHT